MSLSNTPNCLRAPVKMKLFWPLEDHDTVKSSTVGKFCHLLFIVSCDRLKFSFDSGCGRSIQAIGADVQS
jgi:hypothetical protein